MMRYSEKVVLKSNIYKFKDQSPAKKNISKSPHTSTKQGETSKQKVRIDPSELFQKVCCPNCKYLFKIIKNE